MVNDGKLAQLADIGWDDLKVCVTLLCSVSQWDRAPSGFCCYLFHMASFLLFYLSYIIFPTLLSVLPGITL